MKAFLALLGVNFKSLMLNSMGTSRRRKNRNKSASGLGAMGLIVVIMVYISSVWSSTIAGTLAPVGGLDLLIALMMVFSLIFPLFFTMYAAQGTLFSTKDIDLVLSLPVPTFYIMLARLMALYLQTALMLECLLIPAGVVYLMNGGAGGAGFLVVLIVQGLFLALLPTLITLIFGYVISLLVSRMRHKNLFSIIFSILLIAVIMVGVLFMNTGMENLAADVAGVRQMLFSSAPPLGWAVTAATEFNFLNLLLIIVLCVVPFLVISWLFSLNFKSLLTRLSSNALRSDYKIGTLSASSSLGALFKKEARRFFGTPAYFLNTAIGNLMVIVGAVAALIFRGTIQDFLAVFTSQPGGEILLEYVSPIVLAFVVIFLFFSIPSSVSVSLEGKTLWILKAAPVSTGRIFFAKAGFSAVVGIVTAVVAVPLLGVAFGLPVLHVICIFIISLLLNIHVGMLGLYVNLRFPRLDYENETVVIKQSASLMFSMLLCLLSMAILVGVYILMNFLGANFLLYCLAAIVVLLVMTFILYSRLNTKGRQLFAELS